ncbi:MAG: iron-containing redox enzyme family protein [Comamonadaceae bacterium]|nr:MAG: iron-containing redox enzyme family protein [Comamonadaceae bacterium]
MEASARRTTDAYQDYLASRKAGAPRRYFSNRAHALNFLQSVAPTKLVDGSWLYGTLPYRADPRMSGLAQTYLEELGNGDETKNHVLLYKKLLDAHGLSSGTHLPDSYFEQGAIQLALGVVTERMLPEVIGFNLGYEQLPLHLLITAFELDELGIDPYYFTLHVTVDNADSGHARRAIDAVELNASRYGDGAEYWRRVRTGYRLNDLGLGTTAAIEAFDVDAEVIRIFTAKSAVGAGAHSDYCRIGGRTVNEWLGGVEPVSAFLHALESKGWIVKGPDPSSSRFWQLLQGERAEMFGVFTDYELQVIFDWMRGDHSTDGLRFDASPAERGARVRSFRAQARLNLRNNSPVSTPRVVQSRLGGRNEGSLPAAAAGIDVLSPGHHWTLEGLQATRSLVNAERGGFAGGGSQGVYPTQGHRI